MYRLHFNLCSLVFLCLFQRSLSWGWFSSTKTPQPTANAGIAAEFSMDIPNSRKGMELVENAKKKLVSSNSCWQNAYRNLFASCSEIIGDKEKQSRLAWHLSDCFQKDSARPPFPSCNMGTPMMKCLENLDDFGHKVYLEFFLETNSICHQLQADAFKHETERLVNELKMSGQDANDKLENIQERSESILQGFDGIRDSASSVDLRIQQVDQTLNNVEDQIHDLLNHSDAIFKHAEGIAASQSQLQKGQAEMKAKIEADMKFLLESHESLGDGMEKLKKGAEEIEREINEVGDSMSEKMQTLQGKADDLGDAASITLDKHQQLLDGQSLALEGLNFLTKFQSEALEESKALLQTIVEFGHRQQEELLQRQQQLQQAHDHLIQNSQSILAAQEAFESKQSTMFIALEKLFALHNAILLESRFLKSFFIYCCLTVVVFVLTSTKQTSAVRARLYLGVFTTLAVEIAISRRGANDIDRQTWIESNVFWARSCFLLVAAIQILYAFFTYRDYEILNHHMLLAHNQMLLGLTQRADIMERMMGKMFLSRSKQSNGLSYPWVDKELPVNIDAHKSPHISRLAEEVAENSVSLISGSTRYDLRPRRRK